MSAVLRVGWSTVPVAVTVVGDPTLLPDCTLVNASRFRIIHSTDPATGTGTAISATISAAVTGSYVATFTPTPTDAATTTAAADTLQVYVDSSTNGGTTWIPTHDPVTIQVRPQNQP